jgi:ubiquinone/menaquinone biosynthesis C-methylase UbiE
MPDHFSLIAPFYERFMGFMDPAPLCEHLQLPVAGRLLDAGGGTGRAVHALRGLAGEIVVSDVSTGMLRQAAAKEGVVAVQSQVERLPFADATFERIIVVDAFHHFADHQQAIAELWRVLTPGGRMVIEEPNIERLSIKLIALGERLLLMRSTFYSPRAMGRMLEMVGAHVHAESDHPFNSWVVADKVPDPVTP